MSVIIIPEKITAQADITTATRQTVSVTANFTADSVLRKYSFDNIAWMVYPGSVFFSVNGSVLFRGFDQDGFLVETGEYTVGNIEPPVEVYSFAGDASTGPQVVGLFTSGLYTVRGNFGDLTGSVTVFSNGKKVASGSVKNGVLSFNSGKPVLLDSDYETTIQVDVKNGTFTNYQLELVADVLFNHVDQTGVDGAVGLDVISSVGPLVTTGWVGYRSEIDFYSFTLVSGTKMSFHVTGEEKLKFTVYSLTTDKHGDPVLKQVQSASLSLPKGQVEYSVDTKSLLLEAGLYCFSVENPNATKKGGSSNYTVSVNADAKFFPAGDLADNDSATAKDLGVVTSAGLLDTGWVGFGDEINYRTVALSVPTKMSFRLESSDAAKLTVYQLNAKGKLQSLGNVSVKAGAAGNMKSIFALAGMYYFSVQSTNAKKGGDANYSVSLDAGQTVFYPKGNNADDEAATAKDLGVVSTAGVLVEDWVGFGDTVDYQQFTLTSAAKLNFKVSALDAVKFTVFSLNSKGKLQSLGSISVKAGMAANTKDLFVDAGVYYLSTQSTNAKKGGDADYSVKLNDTTRFYTLADNTNDTWQAASNQTPKLIGEVISGWVGYSDVSDFIKFQLDGSGQLQLNLDQVTADAYAAKQIKLTCLDQNGKSVAIALGKDDPQTLFSKKELYPGVYYLGVTCANAKKYETSYSFTTGLGMLA